MRLMGPIGRRKACDAFEDENEDEGAWGRDVSIKVCIFTLGVT